jgi:hypothetical protein
VDVLKARYRQSSHERGELMAVVAEVIRRTEADTTASDDCPVEFGTDEVRAALVLTRRAAGDLCGLAEDLTQRLPRVQAALATGVLDQPRARVFSLWTENLADAHARAVVARLLPLAHRLTTGQLIREISRLAIALDPNWARRQHKKALTGRRVVGSNNPDGTANLCGSDLPLDQVAAACDRLDRLAKAAKQAGHPDPIDHVRADLFLALLDGSHQGLTDTQILNRFLATVDTTATHADKHETASDDQPDQAEPAGAEPTDRPEGDGRADAAQPNSAESTADSPRATPENEQTVANEQTDRAHPPESVPALDSKQAADVEHAGPAGGDATGRSPGGLRLLVRLATLVGADSRPGELIGWGPVHAELARTMASTPGAAWWYVLTDAGGAPLAIGQIRRRPTSFDAPARGYPGPQVWVQVNETTLAALRRLEHPAGWDRIIAEIHANAQPGAGPPNGDPTARLPGVALRRWIQVRDRECAFPLLPGARPPGRRRPHHPPRQRRADQGHQSRPRLPPRPPGPSRRPLERHPDQARALHLDESARPHIPTPTPTQPRRAARPYGHPERHRRGRGRRVAQPIHSGLAHHHLHGAHQIPASATTTSTTPNAAARGGHPTLLTSIAQLGGHSVHQRIVWPPCCHGIDSVTNSR